MHMQPQEREIIFTCMHTIDGENITVENDASTFKVLLPSSRAGKTEYIIVLELNGDAETIPVLKN